MLKFGQPRNAYELLGLPRSATSTQVRTRFRQLVRGYQKDLPTKELLKDEKFRQWVNAYLQLTGPDRREYDRRLRQRRGREEAADLISALSEPQLMLLEAEAALVRRKLKEGTELAKAALKQDPKNAGGYALLGDLLREQGKYNDALTMYNYAIQFDPNNRRYWQLLQEVTALREGKALPRRYRSTRPTIFNRPPIAWFAIILTMVLVGLTMVLSRQYWGEPWLFHIPKSLIIVAVADGFVLGLILAGTSAIGPFDDELVSYSISGFGPNMTPVGLFVIAPGVVFFWLAPVFYAVCALLDEHVSLSVVIALGCCGALDLALGALAPPEARKAVYALGGNFVFFGFLWGWMFGSIRRRVFEY